MSTYIHTQVDAARAGTNAKVIARMDAGWAVMGDTQFLRGYCLLLPDPVVGSLNDLDEMSRRAYLADMVRLGDAVTAVCSPRRINYSILGNLEPALHAHVFPRFEDEPESLRTAPVWKYDESVWSDTAHAFDPKAHGELRDAIRAALETVSVGVGPAFQAAASFAARMHAGQMRKDGVTPYFSHPVRVAMTVRDVFGVHDESVIAAALMRDTIEDTPADYDDVREIGGAFVADLVVAMTKDMRLREDAREPAYDAQLAAADWRARLIKLADVYDNLCDVATTSGRVKWTGMVEKAERAIELAAPDAAANPVMARAVAAVQQVIKNGVPASYLEARQGWDE